MMDPCVIFPIAPAWRGRALSAGELAADGALRAECQPRCRRCGGRIINVVEHDGMNEWNECEDCGRLWRPREEHIL